MLTNPHPARDLRLDLIRGLAALLVTMGHLRAVLFVDQPQLIDGGVLTKIFYLLTSLGHQSVVVFFVLSGYLVGGSVLAAGSQFSLSAYMRARLARLWVVLIPCLVLTWAIDLLVAHWAPDVVTGLYAERWHVGPRPGEFDNSVGTLIGNVFFLQTTVVPVFGSNGPLWSLANEFWYYVLFPLMYGLVGTRIYAQGRGQAFMTVVVVAAIVWAMPTDMLVGFGVWLLGVWVAQVRLAPRAWMGLTSLGLLAATIAFSKWAVIAGWPLWGDVVLGIGVAWALHATRSWRLHSDSTIGLCAQRISDLSFSLYLSHFPFVMLLGAIFSRAQRIQPGLMPLIGFFLAICGLLGVAYFFWYAFERHTPQVRRWLAIFPTKLWGIASVK